MKVSRLGHFGTGAADLKVSTRIPKFKVGHVLGSKLKMLTCVLIVLVRAQYSAGDLVTPPSIMWALAGGGQVLAADLDGSNQRLVVETEYYLYGMAADITSETVFWSGSTGGISSAKWDGTGIQPIYPFAGTTGLAITPQHLYWGEYGWDGHALTGKIRRSHYDGSEVEDVVDGVVPFGVAVDPASNLVFWSDRGPDGSDPKIKRANLDGSQIETIADLDYEGRGMAVSSNLRKVYWVRYPYGIFRSNLDGSDTEFVVNQTGGSDVAPLSVTIALDGSGIYFGTIDSIWRADLDGDNPQRIIENTGMVQALSVVPEPTTLSLFLCFAIMTIQTRSRWPYW